MNAKYIYSKTIEELIKSPQHFEDGTIAIIDDNKCYVYNNGWNPISNVQMENEGISIDLYSLNKNIMNQMKFKLNYNKMKIYLKNPLEMQKLYNRKCLKL